LRLFAQKSAFFTVLRPFFSSFLEWKIVSRMDNPLAPCPGTPNCERESRAFPAHAPGALFEKAQDALGALGPARLTLRDGSSDGNLRRVDAVFRVALIFNDDVAVAVTPGEEGGAVLHIRSASRVGKSDLGVNRRRVKRFFRALQKAL
jgi:uncharacterized protein (DUF1499 family)